MENKKKEIEILNSEQSRKIKQGQTMKKKAETEREKYRSKAFRLMLELAVVIALPAFLALWQGKKLDKAHDSGLTYTLIFLGIAFVLSWTIIIIKYIKMDREIKNIENKIKQEQEQKRK